MECQNHMAFIPRYGRRTQHTAQAFDKLAKKSRYGGKRRNVAAQHPWAPSDWDSPLRHDEAPVQEHIREEEEECRRLDRLRLLDDIDLGRFLY
jgi:hypothetical protein